MSNKSKGATFMTCDMCGRQMNYSFYLNDEFWRKVVGDEHFENSIGRICAHCTLETLGGVAWYIVWNEPAAKTVQNATSEIRPCSECEELMESPKKNGVPAANEEAGNAFLTHMSEINARRKTNEHATNNRSD